MTARALPRHLLRWLPGPVLTDEHRTEATSHVAADLARRAARASYHSPTTWLKVAQGLGIATCPYYRPGESAGRLHFDIERDTWAILYNLSRPRIRQAAVLVHELAHYFLREARGEWLCGEPVVYYYEGPVEEERHRLARQVERELVPIRLSVPREGLFQRRGQG